MRATLSVMTLLCSCYAPAVEALDELPVEPPEQQPAPAPEPVAETPRIVCDMAKFSFTQELGCVNDGWVEFCAEKAGAPVVTQLRAIAPGVSIMEGRTGRAGCNEATEYLVSQPLSESDCTGRHGALTDPAWNTLCALSQVPETKRFVPGFAE